MPETTRHHYRSCIHVPMGKSYYDRKRGLECWTLTCICEFIGKLCSRQRFSEVFLNLYDFHYRVVSVFKHFTENLFSPTELLWLKDLLKEAKCKCSLQLFCDNSALLCIFFHLFCMAKWMSLYRRIMFGAHAIFK